MDSKPPRRENHSDGSDVDSRRPESSRRRRDTSRSRDRQERRPRSNSRDGYADQRRNRKSHAAGSDEEPSHRRTTHRRDRRDRSADRSADEDRRRRKHRDRSQPRDHGELSRRHRSRSPPAKKRRERSRSRSKSPAKAPVQRSRAALPSQNDSFRGEVAPGEAPPPEKQKPNFKPTGLLAKEANTVAGTTTVLKYHEPPEGRKPSSRDQWRMYIFKKKDLLDTIYLHQRSVWLMGRDPKITDLLLEHPSISKQHAVIQFRHMTSTNEYGDRTSKVKPYLIDLESTKGTTLNGKKIEASRYVELVDQDVLGFGDSEREYVMMLPVADK
ncbi:related to PML1 Subunit of the RES complex, which is required for nuclear retention of unspliced pre-mRNAs [Ramularia collo-cygni]|uniref:Related to PML1 Subunit of the RES complex, which is required for nuclear retention of unspliced pre-mRNAs n=1 Tax=Ramularia collo-cygni TaxID=112498 RepID=A0A2D3V924_9PEZI|nr:related to PML1 Subunit of the RES complex, which is required for nuclear retention of unspliced pre-mRNAs [Ramularia collo-cygni]CZT23430.1 related to PML1 Subunit of the RES complex, which is required for nuclear retention of unspliced pre-mRNAs [Ramularia collo-cygni]